MPDRGDRSSEQRPATVTVKLCGCGLVWVGGNSKYCPGGHAYEFTEREYVPAGALLGEEPS
jgi:hypothetical protein